MVYGIQVNLPTVTSFLMLYSLGTGAILICFWTLGRAIFYLIFFLIGGFIVFTSSPIQIAGSEIDVEPPKDAVFYLALFSYFVLCIAEAFLVRFTIDLAIALYQENRHRIEGYLICRFITWILEVIFLTTSCITHFPFVPLYLVFLLFVILELYGFIVVFSYFKDSGRDVSSDARRKTLPPCPGSNKPCRAAVPC